MIFDAKTLGLEGREISDSWSGAAHGKRRASASLYATRNDVLRFFEKEIPGWRAEVYNC